MAWKDLARRFIPEAIDAGVDLLFRARTKRIEEEEEAEVSLESARETHDIEEGRSYEGQSEVDYCLECCAKHGQTAKVLMREAMQRAESGKSSDPGVQEKVRGVVEELCGFEDDSTTVRNERVTLLNKMARDLRKYIYTVRAEVGGASKEQLAEIKEMVDKLVEASYTVRSYEECPVCQVEDVCGGNVDCLTFLVEAAEKSKTNEEWKGYLEEARIRWKK